MRKNTPRSNASRVSIRWKLIVYFAVFVAISILVMWVFQVHLLSNVYEFTKRREMAHSAQELSKYIGKEELDTQAYDHAFDNIMAVTIYRVSENGTFEEIVNIDPTDQQDNVASHQQLQLERYYQKVLDNDGAYTGDFTPEGIEIPRREFPLIRLGESAASHKNSRSNVRLIHLYLTQDSQETSYLMILNASLQPLNSTVAILRVLFMGVFSVLLILASIMVWLLYRRITTPLVKMNESAKQLAHGKYDVEFSADDYREAHELAATLNYASYELSRLDSLQKELIANISHDLRTPLTMIKGYGEVMRDIPGENTAENIQVVIDETTRLSELVNDLLDLSKIQSGARKAMFEAFDLTAAVEEVMRRYDAFTSHQGYHITFISNERANVFADRSMILQVLYNLINNAINYTGEDLSVTVCQSVREGRVRISVTDTGEGIAEDELPQIWNRYYKVDKVHRRAMIGTGLGLSIVKGVLELHNAAYGIESQVGEGSTFWFELDVLDSAQGAHQTLEQLED